MGDELEKQLSSWKGDVEIPRRFQADVWQRIAARDAARRTRAWYQLREWFSVRLAKPSYATALVVAGVSISLGVAHVQAQSANARHWRELETRYVSSINPNAAVSL
ncbi:MAG TPA: hypothetical protein VGQ82_11240 [Chthoniobacterales bacterium]|nr:hypothetical protein [Chthoniobacterales bacterium]